MRKVFLIALMLVVSANLFATHYQQKGNINDTESKYVVYQKELRKLPDLNIKPFYDFYGDCSGLKDQETGLVKTGLAEFIGASGKTHHIVDAFMMYERRARAAKGDVYFVSNHDADMIAIINKKGDDYTIDIYTGQDALEKKIELQRQQK